MQERPAKMEVFRSKKIFKKIRKKGLQSGKSSSRIQSRSKKVKLIFKQKLFPFKDNSLNQDKLKKPDFQEER